LSLLVVADATALPAVSTKQIEKVVVVCLVAASYVLSAFT